MIHNLKIYDNFADDVYNGNKTFEIRKNDRKYQVGDRIKFTAITVNSNGEEKILRHSINYTVYDIIYVLSENDLPKESKMLMPGYVILGIKEFIV